MALDKNILNIFKKLISLNSTCYRTNRELVEFVAGLFKSDKRFQLKLWPVKKGDYYVYNLLVKLPGKDKTSPLIFAGHSDTVSAEPTLWSSSPFKLKNSKGRLFGLGASDMKGALALMIYQLLNIKNTPQRDIYFCLTADEEDSGLGIKSMAVELKRRKIKSALIILGEPTNGQIRLGQKACLSYRLSLENKRSGHAAYFKYKENLLLNPLQQTMLIVLRLNKWVEELNKKYGSSKNYGAVTFNFGQCVGGRSANILPARAVTQFDLRFPPLPAYKDLTGLDKRIRAIIARRLSPYLKFQLVNKFKGGFYKLEANASAVKSVQQAYKSIIGKPSSFFYGLGWTEAAYYQSFGEVIVLGPGRPDQAHRVNEFIEIKKMETTNQIYEYLKTKI